VSSSEAKGLSPSRFKVSFNIKEPKVTTDVLLSDPPKEPTGVLMPPIITTSLIYVSPLLMLAVLEKYLRIKGAFIYSFLLI
jgi:hypothetical protein